MTAPATMPAERGSAPVRGAWIREFWRSSIGKKQIVALTGVVLVLYVIAHMLGNLKAFQGIGLNGAALDGYAEWLREAGDPVIPREGMLWFARAVLLACFVVHIVGVLQLAKWNRERRPPRERIASTLASRTMLVGGLFLLAFIVFHILHLTLGAIAPGDFREGAVYSNLDAAFESPVFLVIYVLAAIALGLHLHHAVWSVMQTAGWDKPNRNPTFRRTSAFVAVAVTVGFAAVPIAFFAGLMDDPPTERPRAEVSVTR